MAQRAFHNPHNFALKIIGVIYYTLHVVVTDADGVISRFIGDKKKRVCRF